jgi:hypothetical protein
LLQEHYRFLIPKLSSLNLAAEAFEEARRLQENGVRVDGWIYRSCMYGCCRAGLCDMAARLYQVRSGRGLDRGAFCWLIWMLGCGVAFSRLFSAEDSCMYPSQLEKMRLASMDRTLTDRLSQ